MIYKSLELNYLNDKIFNLFKSTNSVQKTFVKRKKQLGFLLEPHNFQTDLLDSSDCSLAFQSQYTVK